VSDGFFEKSRFFGCRSARPLASLVSARRSFLVGTSWGPSIATHSTTLAESDKDKVRSRPFSLHALIAFGLRGEKPEGDRLDDAKEVPSLYGDCRQ
jgi:hypothetical protein